MFEQTLSLLLAGEFVCAVRYPEQWRLLQDEGQRREAERLLEKLGRRLARTRHEGAWFVAYKSIGPDERLAIRGEFTDIKHNLRLLVGFFVHVMQALHQEQFLAPGSVIEANRLMAAIDANPSLRRELQDIANLGKGTIGDGTLRGALDRLLKKLQNDGYLMLANPEREIYEVTGKIEYLQELVDFLMEHEQIRDELDEEIDEAGRQESLL